MVANVLQPSGLTEVGSMVTCSGQDDGTGGNSSGRPRVAAGAPGCRARRGIAAILAGQAATAAGSVGRARIPSSFMPQPLGPSPVRFAANGPISLAYQVLGDGPTTILVVTGWVLPMESIWDDPAYVRFIERLAGEARVVLWDKRGTGMSD